MKHYIIAKFKDRNDIERFLPDITKLFNRTLALEGVECVDIHKSNSTRENRYSLMIEMTLTPEGLNAFDASDEHRLWKETYGERLESKAIFDCE